ncbi:hypothetical protein BYI23_A006630 [Burkholderia sp. YI23]|nr:hypothetical protein BYI23_A006630 [Burkholderia sp. YI23]
MIRAAAARARGGRLEQGRVGHGSGSRKLDGKSPPCLSSFAADFIVIHRQASVADMPTGRAARQKWDNADSSPGRQTRAIPKALSRAPGVSLNRPSQGRLTSRDVP